MPRLPSNVRSQQGGFTLIEIMIALTVLLVGISGILALQLTLTRSTGFSRHMAEASQLGEDKMEVLMLLPVTTLGNMGTKDGTPGEVEGPMNAYGETGIFTRETTVDTSANTGFFVLKVEVKWLERGADAYSVILTNQRSVN